MSRSTILLATLIFIQGCSQNRLPIESNIYCGVDVKELDGYGLVSFSVNGTKLGKSEIKVFPYHLTNEGCALIPPDASDYIKVKHKNYAAIKDVKELKGKLTKNFELIKVDEDSDHSYLYCGENEEQGFATIKFTHPDDLGEEPYFLDTDNNETKLEVSSLNCAKIPKKPGKIVINDGLEVFLKNPESFNLVDKAEQQIIGFDKVCRKLGKKDKIVEILANHFKTDDCDEIKKRSAELSQDDKELFYKKSITNINALGGLPFETLDLCENDFIDLRPLSEVKNLKYLQIIGAEIISLEGLPKGLETLLLGYTPYLSNLNHAPSSITSLEIYGPKAVKSFSGVSSLTNLNNLTIYNISDVEKKSELKKLKNVSSIKIVESYGFQDVLNDWKLDSLEDFGVITSDLNSSKFLENFKNVREVKIQQSNISEWSAINNLEMLSFLSIVQSPTSNLSYLKSQTLETLYIAGTRVADLKFLDNTPMVRHLSMSGTLVSDLSPLSALRLERFVFNRPQANITNCPTENVSEIVKNYCHQYNQNKS